MASSIFLGIGLKQQLDRFVMPVLGRMVQRCVPIFIYHIGILRAPQQLFENTESLFLDAGIICWVRSALGGQNSRKSSWILTGAREKVSSSGISAEPSSEKILCLNLETPNLRCAFPEAIRIESNYVSNKLPKCFYQWENEQQIIPNTIFYTNQKAD